MFKYPEDISFTPMTAGSNIPAAWSDLKFSAAPRYPNPAKKGIEGAVLVMQYVEGYVYRTYGMYRANDDMIESLHRKALELEGNSDSEDYPQLASLMQACFTLGYVCNGTGGSALGCEIGYVRNQTNDLKYFLRQYGQLIIETKLTTTTYNQYGYEINSAGTTLEYAEYSKGFIMYGYDANGIFIQNTLGPFVGSLGFHHMTWSVVSQVVKRGACWRLRNPG